MLSYLRRNQWALYCVMLVRVALMKAYPNYGEEVRKERMTVKIRLKRTGKKKTPSYRVVVADLRSPRDGRIIENLGWYNPLTDPSTIQINEEKVLGWLRNGAQPTDSVESLLRRTGVAGRFEQEKAAAKAARTAPTAQTEQ